MPMTAELHDLIARKNIAAAKGLLKSLVPRAQCFCFYDLARDCVWSSDGVDDYEIDNYITELPPDIVAGLVPDSNLLRRTLTSGRTLLLLPIYGDKKKGLGLLAAVFSKNAGKSSWFNPSMLRRILMPAVEVIGENLRLHRQHSQARRDADASESELALVYKVDEKIHATSRSHAGLAQLIGQSGRFLEIAYSVLLLRAKRIRISATHSSWKGANKKAVDKYIISSLLPKLEGKRSPILFDVPPIDGSDNIVDLGYQAMLCPITDRGGNLEGVLAQLSRINGDSFEDNHLRFMSHITRKVEYVIEQSFDSMTGLMNRSGFEAQLQESRRALASDKDEHQMIYFDLDNLQLVNDTFGREAGDEVIKRFSQMLEDELPKNAVASRLTGDDFAILLTHSNQESALELTDTIRKNGVQLRYLQGDKSLQVSFSIGIAAFTRRAQNGSDVVTAARIACESAKDHGRDRVEIYDADDQSIIRRYDDMHMVSQIQQALDSDTFQLVAQPIVSLTGKDDRSRFEILLRMKDSDGNKVPTSAFLSAAERYQMMPQIDRWVVSATLARLSEHAEFLTRSNTVFAINLSGQSLGDDEILNFIEEELDACGLPASNLCFEVTESAAVSNRKKAQSFIDALRRRGCKFSLDDFGAGLSSFAYLKSFNVDTLKIDGGFIRDITENRISESMVAAITQVAKVMELDTVAEYVESRASMELVTKLGVDYAQGHIFGMPTKLEDVLAELTDQAQSA
jgi:diguanylate cyclase (GGDEF)-like protein